MLQQSASEEQLNMMLNQSMTRVSLLVVTRQSADSPGTFCIRTSVLQNASCHELPCFAYPPTRVPFQPAVVSNHG